LRLSNFKPLYTLIAHRKKGFQSGGLFLIIIDIFTRSKEKGD